MISYLSGKIIKRADNFVIVEVNGVGYEVFLSEQSIGKIPEMGSDFRCFCYLEVSERGVKLFGFLNFEELEFFKIVRNIQGVGPRAALEISSIGPLEKIQTEIEKGNLKFLDGISGIGPKKAAKIILELSGQIKTNIGSKKKNKDATDNDEAFLALKQLGFSREQIQNALAALPPDIRDPREKIKQALKFLDN